MAERRCSAHAGEDQDNGGTLKARKPRDPLSSYIIDQWSDIISKEAADARDNKFPELHAIGQINIKQCLVPTHNASLIPI